MNDEFELVERLLDDYALRRRQGIQAFYDLTTPRCESPIERVMLAALACEAMRMPVFPVVWHRAESGPQQRGVLYAYAQHQVGPYRVDFALFGRFPGGNVQFAIECDGHDFHERTKEQAAHDKQRDRELQGVGFRVLRFTGSEIWRDASRCAAEVFDQVWTVATSGMETAA